MVSISPARRHGSNRHRGERLSPLVCCTLGMDADTDEGSPFLGRLRRCVCFSLVTRGAGQRRRPGHLQLGWGGQRTRPRSRRRGFRLFSTAADRGAASLGRHLHYSCWPIARQREQTADGLESELVPIGPATDGQAYQKQRAPKKPGRASSLAQHRKGAGPRGPVSS